MLCLIGPSRLGKTQWARSIADHAYMMGQWNAEECLDGREIVIFDDLECGIERVRAFAFGQSDITVTGKCSFFIHIQS